MLKRGFFFGIVLLGITLVLNGQTNGPEIRFDNREHNYGDIREEGGVVKHTFRFTNVGDAPLQLTNVQPGCGCTASEYTKTPIMPGEGGVVTADFDPRNRPGQFRKHIMVTSNSVRHDNTSLFIEGNVIPRPRDYRDTFRVQLGDFLFDRNNPVFHNMRYNEVRHDTIRFINAGKQSVSVKVDEAPAHIKVSLSGLQFGPMERGYIALRYNAAGVTASGNRNDRIYLQTTDAKLERKMLFVIAQIHPRPQEQPIHQRFPFEVGNMRMSRNAMSFHNILNTETRSDSVLLYNSGDKPMKVDYQKPPSHIQIALSNNVIMPGETVTLRVSFDASQLDVFGIHSADRVMLNTDDEVQPMKIVFLSANIKEDFSHLTEEELAMAPEITFDELIHEFGTVESGTRVKHSFNFTNTGKSELIIRRVNAGCGCTATSPSKTNLQPGESSNIDVTFNTQGRRGQQNMRVTVVTNDPQNPEVYLQIRGTLEQ